MDVRSLGGKRASWSFSAKHADIPPHRVLRCPLWSIASVNVPTLKMAQSTKLCNWSCSRSASMWWHCCRKTSRTLKDTLLPSKFACMWVTIKLALCRVFHTSSGTCAVLILWIHTDLFCCWFKHWCKKSIFCFPLKSSASCVLSSCFLFHNNSLDKRWSRQSAIFV